jgi:Protein of unknown function (DUF3012)
MAATLANGRSAMRELRRAVVLVAMTTWLAACAPEVGSPRWCEAMSEKPRGDWTGNEVVEYARSCVF